MNDRIKEQMLEELSEAQKMLEKKTEIHGRMIKKLQMLIANEGLFSQIIDYFPYPIAIFSPQYTLVMVNKAFAEETKMWPVNLEKGAVRLLQYRTDNMQLAAAVRQVFSGSTSFLEDIKYPFTMFSGIPQCRDLQSDRFSRAVIFPVPADDVKIDHAVIVFMP